MKYFLSIIFIINFLASFASIKEVKKDGSGDYTKIQDAIDSVLWPGDTILVWPGTYYENIDFKGKRSLTLTSLMLTTADEQYKYNTIIDGGKNGRCITINSNEEDAVIFGFTVQNGKTLNYGGGLLAFYPTTVKNCIFRNNFATFAGGAVAVAWETSYLILSKCSIHNNWAYTGGGGILYGYEGTIVFDSVNLNSIYLNFAERGCDLHKSNYDIELNIKLDTSTVINPDTYFFSSIDNEGNQINDQTITVNNGIIQPFDGDLYVNPVSGSDDNSGTTINDPLKTITYAYTKIHVDSTDKNTIHLANGVYSDTTNYEKFPLNIRPFIIVEGESRDGTILDGNKTPYLWKLIKGNNNITDFTYKKMTLKACNIPDYENISRAQLARLYTGCDRFILDSIAFIDSYADDAAGELTYYQADSSVVKNCIFKDNTGGFSIRTASDGDKTQFINNCIFTNQQPDENVPQDELKMGSVIGDGGAGTTIVQNSLFYNNPRMGVSRLFYGNSYYINCTFSDNSWYDDMAFIYDGDANTHLYNCITWNLYSIPMAINVGEWQKMIHSHLNIYNSLIQGGEESITIGSSCWHDDTLWCHVHYDSTNIDADPLFLGMWNDPYMISDGSPCIDAGTLANLPDFIELPEYDLAGNPRVVGDSIDMGAYEWNPTIVGFHDIGQGGNINKNTFLKVSPNPFRENTLIEFFGQEYKSQFSKMGQSKTDFKIEVYDNYGRLVRNILSTTLLQDQKIPWQGDDNNGNLLTAGIYNVVLFSGDKEIESLKVIKQ